MKKIICIAMSFILVFVLASCGPSGVAQETHQQALDKIEDLKDEIRDLKSEIRELSKKIEEAESTAREQAHSDGHMEFTITTDMPFPIFRVFLRPTAAPVEEEEDILPEGVTITLDSPYFFSSDAYINQTAYTDWFIYVIDTDMDSSIDYQVFNPWTVSEINIKWDDHGGYVCDFVYS